LFRNWTRLKSWLEPERARLEALRLLQLDASTWDRNGKDPAFLNHREKRLSEAIALVALGRYREHVGALESGYLAACREAERLARQRWLCVQALVSVLLTVIIGGLAWSKQDYLTARAVTLAEMVWPKVLTAEAARALNTGESVQGMRPLPRNGGAAGGRIHDGIARR
jgi:hypothetical protein